MQHERRRHLGWQLPERVLQVLEALLEIHLAAGSSFEVNCSSEKSSEISTDTGVID